jgi:hypothetical protein
MHKLDKKYPKSILKSIDRTTDATSALFNMTSNQEKDVRKKNKLHHGGSDLTAWRSHIAPHRLDDPDVVIFI